jgi:DUF4097 and DUF4098 domain-containing protein YvlB
MREGVRRGVAVLALLLAPAGLLLAGGAGRHARMIETTLGPRIRITNLAGQVLVRGWDKPQVHVEYTVYSPRVEVDTELLPPTGAADKVRFTTHILDPLVSGSERAADYTLDVPVGASVEIRNPQGTVQIEKLQADAEVESVGGRIAVNDFSGHLIVRSVGGDIEILRPSGRIEAYSITGNLHFVSAATSKLRASTTSGRILYEGDFAAGGDYMLSAYSGDMDIVCPPSASFELRAKTVRGKLQNSLPLTARRRPSSPVYSGNSLLGTHNTGKATVELTSFSGAIRVRPQ